MCRCGLEVLGLGEVGDEGFANSLCFRLWDILVEVDHTACHATFLVRAEVGTGASDDILAVGIDDSGVERFNGCPLTDKPVETVVLAGTSGIVAQQVVP